MSKEKAVSLVPYVTKVMNAMGYNMNHILVSDESLVCDFVTDYDHEDFYKVVSKRLGVIIKYDDYIIEVAKRLYVKDNNGL